MEKGREKYLLSTTPNAGYWFPILLKLKLLLYLRGIPLVTLSVLYGNIRIKYVLIQKWVHGPVKASSQHCAAGKAPLVSSVATGENGRRSQLQLPLSQTLSGPPKPKFFCHLCVPSFPLTPTQRRGSHAPAKALCVSQDNAYTTLSAFTVVYVWPNVISVTKILYASQQQ